MTSVYKATKKDFFVITDENNAVIARASKPKVANIIKSANDQFTPYLELIIKKCK